MQNQDDFKMIFNELLEMNKNGKLTEKKLKKVLLHFSKLCKDQVAFDEACISILDSKN